MMQAGRPGFCAAWLLGCALLTGGCESGGPMPASAVRDPVMTDLPKPAGFALVADKSVAQMSGRVRLAKCLYTGSGRQDTVKRFYEEYMPQAGFGLKRMEMQSGTYYLHFESEKELCEVRVAPARWGRTEVQVSLIPRPEGSTERGPEEAPAAAPPPRRRERPVAP
jgi:hypothetical protein